MQDQHARQIPEHKLAFERAKRIALPKWKPAVLAVPNVCEVCRNPLPRHNDATFVRFCGACRQNRKRR